MITEDYVSFEVAKLLKEKGFDENTEHKMWYVIKQFSTGCQWNSCTHEVGDITREYNNGCCISMPTQQMAMKWLREVYDIKIMIRPYVDGTYSYEILNGFWYVNFDSYENAVEESIKYCLKYLVK